MLYVKCLLLHVLLFCVETLVRLNILNVDDRNVHEKNKEWLVVSKKILALSENNSVILKLIIGFSKMCSSKIVCIFFFCIFFF